MKKMTLTHVHRTGDVHSTLINRSKFFTVKPNERFQKSFSFYNLFAVWIFRRGRWCGERKEKVNFQLYSHPKMITSPPLHVVVKTHIPYWRRLTLYCPIIYIYQIHCISFHLFRFVYSPQSPTHLVVPRSVN